MVKEPTKEKLTTKQHLARIEALLTNEVHGIWVELKWHRWLLGGILFAILALAFGIILKFLAS